MSFNGYAYYYRYPYYNNLQYYPNNRNDYAYPYNYVSPQHNQYHHYYGNPTNISFRQDLLGTRWEGQEMQWKFTWTQIGNSNAFDAVYTHQNDDRTIYATVYIIMNGNKILALRRGVYGGANCNYEGKILDGGRTAKGTVNCNLLGTEPGSIENWSATII